MAFEGTKAEAFEGTKAEASEKDAEAEKPAS